MSSRNRQEQFTIILVVDIKALAWDVEWLLSPHFSQTGDFYRRSKTTSNIPRMHWVTGYNNWIISGGPFRYLIQRVKLLKVFLQYIDTLVITSNRVISKCINDVSIVPEIQWTWKIICAETGSVVLAATNLKPSSQ